MIQIPENLLKVFRDKTVRALAMFDNAKEPSTKSFDEYQNFYQAKIFLEKFKMDGWLMCRDIWNATWKEFEKDLNIKDHNITYLTSLSDCFDLANDINDYSLFTVSYEINTNFEINLTVILYWQKQLLAIYSSINNQDGDEFPIIEKATEFNDIKELSDGSNDFHNISKFTVSLENSDTITDEDISHFRKAAQEIINYFNEHQREIINSLSKKDTSS